MAYSTLKRKTPLKQNKALQARTPLKAKETLQAKTELKAKKPLESKSTLTSKGNGLQSNSTLKSNSTFKSNSTLKAKKSLQDSYKQKVKEGKVKVNRYQKAYKPKFPYWSIFTDDLGMCYITGDTRDIHVHHIFNAANKWASEKYGFLVPLRADWHDMASYGIHFDREFDLRMRRKCQAYWLEHYGTKEEFIAVFGKWW